MSLNDKQTVFVASRTQKLTIRPYFLGPFICSIDGDARRAALFGRLRDLHLKLRCSSFEEYSTKVENIKQNYATRNVKAAIGIES